MDTLTPEMRAELRLRIDERRRQTAAPVKAPRRYTRCKSEQERLERKRRNWRESKRRAKQRMQEAA